MKSSLIRGQPWIGAILALNLVSAALAQSVTINIAEFKEKNVVVIGELGIPLGTVADIEAVLVDGATLGEDHKDLSRDFLLSVETVNGTSLLKPKLLSFRVPFRDLKIPASYEDLRRILPKEATEPDDITESKLQKAAHAYAGKRLKLMVYECGRFAGMPRNWPEDLMPFQSLRFAYASELFVLKKH